MKNLPLIFFTLLICFLMISNPCNSQPKIPSSNRSKKAINRVKPILEKLLLEKELSLGAPIFIRIFKMSKELEVWIKKDKKFHFFKSYKICTYGPSGLGPKTRQGDGFAPEGFYYVSWSRMNPFSQYYLSFNLGYPNSYDRVQKRTGSALMVHGNCVSIGCYAMTDKRIEEIYCLADAALRNGQPFFRVHIFPFKMTTKNMNKFKSHKWFLFWKNLQKGYEIFENHKIPPNVTVVNKLYFFNNSFMD
jgi:murein L,D-transpeptidase YafK